MIKPMITSTEAVTWTGIEQIRAVLDGLIHKRFDGDWTAADAARYEDLTDAEKHLLSEACGLAEEPVRRQPPRQAGGGVAVASARTPGRRAVALTEC
jgi:hypothetical protein